jgi:hypothetical protein
METFTVKVHNFRFDGSLKYALDLLESLPNVLSRPGIPDPRKHGEGRIFSVFLFERPSSQRHSCP